MIDCHVHTARCGHATGDAPAYVDAARARGVSVLTFTEHLPLPDDLDPARTYSMSPDEVGAYASEILTLRETCPDIRLLLGAEADWLPGCLETATAHLGNWPFDVVLGSVHFINGWAFDDPDKLDEWDSQDVDGVWYDYFDRVQAAARSGAFDVMAHPDLVKKFGHRSSFDPRGLFEQVAECFATSGVAIEVSTAGLRKPVGELYPSAEFLTACRRAGVPATMGSDAHTPGEVGYRLADAEDALRRAGYDHAVYFVRRQPKEVPLR